MEFPVSGTPFLLAGLKKRPEYLFILYATILVYESSGWDHLAQQGVQIAHTHQIISQ